MGPLICKIDEQTSAHPPFFHDYLEILNGRLSGILWYTVVQGYSIMLVVICQGLLVFCNIKAILCENTFCSKCHEHIISGEFHVFHLGSIYD